MRICVLDENKVCDECGACNQCDLDPNKVCDNCCRCIDGEEMDFAQITIADVLTKDVDEYLDAYYDDADGESSEDGF